MNWPATEPNSRSGRWRRRFALAFLAPLILLSCSPPIWFEAPTPDQTERSKIAGKLKGRADSPAGAEVLQATFKFPDAPGRAGQLSLSLPESAALPRYGLIRELATVLEAPGLYLGVQDENGEFVHLIRLGDPRFVRSEVDRAGTLRATMTRAEGGVVSARIPFAPDGALRIFEIENRAVSVIHLDAPLGPPSFPERGWKGWP